MELPIDDDIPVHREQAGRLVPLAHARPIHIHAHTGAAAVTVKGKKRPLRWRGAPRGGPIFVVDEAAGAFAEEEVSLVPCGRGYCLVHEANGVLRVRTPGPRLPHVPFPWGRSAVAGRAVVHFGLPADTAKPGAFLDAVVDALESADLEPTAASTADPDQFHWTVTLALSPEEVSDSDIAEALSDVPIEVGAGSPDGERELNAAYQVIADLKRQLADALAWRTARYAEVALELQKVRAELTAEQSAHRIIHQRAEVLERDLRSAREEQKAALESEGSSHHQVAQLLRSFSKARDDYEAKIACLVDKLEELRSEYRSLQDMLSENEDELIDLRHRAAAAEENLQRAEHPASARRFGAERELGLLADVLEVFAPRVKLARAGEEAFKRGMRMSKQLLSQIGSLSAGKTVPTGWHAGDWREVKEHLPSAGGQRGRLYYRRNGDDSLTVLPWFKQDDAAQERLHERLRDQPDLPVDVRRHH